MNKATVALMSVCLLLSACLREGDRPALEQLRRDLMGHEIDYQYDKHAGGGQKWTVKEGEVKGLTVQQWITEEKGAVYKIPAAVTLSDGRTTIRGVLVFHYRKVGPTWECRLVAPRDSGFRKSFSFEGIKKNQ